MTSRREFLALSISSAAVLATGGMPGTRRKGTRRSRSWQSCPDLPYRTQEVYAAVREGEIVVAGGLRSDATSATRFETLSGTAIYEPESGIWKVGADLPEPRHHLVLSAHHDTVYGFGGFVGESLRQGFQFRNDVFALQGEQWSHVGQMPVPLGETVAVTVNERIHLVTGSLHGRPAQTIGEDSNCHLVYEAKTGSWTRARPAETARSSATGAVIEGKIYLVGGRRRDDGFENVGALECYDPQADVWEKRRPLPEPAGGLAGAAINGRLYCFGGERFGPGGGEVFSATWAYDPSADEWEKKEPMKTSRHGMAAAATKGKLYAIGGNTAPGVGAATSSTVDAYRPQGGV